MSTFQYIIDAILSALPHLVPIPDSVPQQIESLLLRWPTSPPEIHFLVALMGSGCFIFFFRFDWLGLLSALIKTVTNPMSIKEETRTLDQQTVLFLSLIMIPSLIAQHFILPHLRENEMVTHSFVMAGVFFLVAYLFYFAANWNKRLKGLNHIRLMDGLWIGLFTLLSAHPAISLVFTLWVAFALLNYHYDTIFKYSSLVLGLHLFVYLFGLLGEVSLKSTLETVGHLNSIAVAVIAMTTCWMALENLEKNLNEGTLKTFKWMSLVFGIFFGATHFLK